MSNSTLYGNAAAGGPGGYGGSGGNGTATGGNGGVGNGGNGSSGAVAMDNTTLTAINVTIASNSAAGGAAGVGGAGGTGPGGNGFAAINGNAGSGHAGAISVSKVLTLTNTIVANNSVGPGPANSGPDLLGNVKLINSLVTSAPDATTSYTVLAGSANNLLNTPANLGPLQNNGGPTKTARPLPSSRAIDHGDTAAAVTQFGANGFDQRGPGFPRVVGPAVDIGAAEVQPPATQVSGNGHLFAAGDTTPSTTDFTDFGVTTQGGAALTRTFLVKNTGENTLTVNTIGLPGAQFTVTVPLKKNLAPGESDSFTVALSTATAGTFAGDIVIGTNDPQTSAFTFRVTGKINPKVTAKAIKINFEPAGSSVPSG